MTPLTTLYIFALHSEASLSVTDQLIVTLTRPRHLLTLTWAPHPVTQSGADAHNDMRYL